MSLVIGVRRESRQDFRSFVGISSRLQVESEDVRMAFLTSSVEAREKVDRRGGGVDGVR